MKVKIVTVGKRHDKNLHVAIDDYQKRLQSSARIEWRIIAPVQRDNVLDQQKLESAAIIRQLQDSDYVILLDEGGQQLNNHELADILSKQSTTTVCFVIGGAYGVDDSLKQRADFVWSLSKLVFPHQLVRLILVEQLYRSVSINQHHPYHHA